MSVRRRASGRAHYNYFRDYDPTIGRYEESDPIGLQDGPSTFSYVKGNPIRLIDPRGLASVGDYIDCLAARVAGDSYRDCNMTLFAAATESATKDIVTGCRVIYDTMECTAVCAAKEIVGANITEFALNVHKEAAMRALEKVAKETASKWAKRLIPVVGQIDTIAGVYGTAVCTIDCAKAK